MNETYPPLYSEADLGGQEVPAALIEGLMWPRNLVAIEGLADSHVPAQVAAGLAGCIATGVPWLGYAAPDPGDVLWASNLSVNRDALIFGAWRRGHLGANSTLGENVKFTKLPFIERGRTPAWNAWCRSIEKHVRDHNTRLVVVNPNSAIGEFPWLWEWMRSLQENTGAAVLLIHSVIRKHEKLSPSKIGECNLMFSAKETERGAILAMERIRDAPIWDTSVHLHHRVTRLKPDRTGAPRSGSYLSTRKGSYLSTR